MEIAIHEQDGVIICRFTGEVRFEDMMESWRQLFAKYPNLQDYKGILATLLDAQIMKHEAENLNMMVDLLKEHLEELKDLRIAIVTDTPMVTNTIIVGRRVKSLQIRPFSTVDAAMRWINI